MRVWLLILALAISLPSRGLAQGDPGTETKVREEIDTKGAVTVILLSGLGGAVLGLSTLSFYSHPQRHLSNISIGAALAVVGAAIYVTYRAAVGRNVKVNFEGAENLNKSSLDLEEIPELYRGPSSMLTQASTPAISIDLLTVTF